MDNNTLQHHGVKGMRWGHRKKYMTVGQAHGRATKAGKEAYKNSMLDSKANNKQQKGLNKNQKKRILKGAAICTGILAAGGVTVAAINIATNSAGRSAVKNILSADTLKDMGVKTFEYTKF